jgi:hypothetical protein
MTNKLLAAIALALSSVAPAAIAGECEDNFSKSGSIFSGTDFSRRFTVPDQSVKDAMAQMRGIMIGEKMDVITEDVETGAMLAEQRSTRKGDRVVFKGQFLRYDDFKRVLWLQNCVQTR